MTAFRRYARAFFIALRMTLRGEKPPEPRYPAFVIWSRQTVVLLDEVSKAAASAGLDASRRKSISLKLDGRMLDLDTILGTLRYHAAQEYPSLLGSGVPHSLMAVQAGNINDRYWVTRLLQEATLGDTSLQAALQKLAAHMDAIPPIQPAQNQP